MPNTRPAEDGERFQQVIVRMPADMHAEIKQRAEREERSMSQTIRRAVRQYLAAAPAG